MPGITLLVNDVLYSGWKQASIDLSIETLAGKFTLVLTDRWYNQPKPVVIKPNDSCLLSIDDEVVITGYIDIVNISMDSGNHTIQIAGRDKTADLIDCSAVTGTGQYKNLKLEQIVTRICEPFSIKVSAEIDTGEPFKTFNAEQGSTALECIQKLCYARQCLATSDGKGGVLITRAGSQGTQTPLIQGINIKSGAANYDFTARYNQYIVKGQSQGTDDTDVNSNAGASSTAKDSGVVRYRPLVIIADGQASSADCKQRANWELNTRIGRSRRIAITVNGWQDQVDGKLWKINKLCFVDSNILGVYDQLLIVAINFSIGTGGEIATLTLTSPDAYLTLLTESLNADLNPYLPTPDEA